MLSTGHEYDIPNDDLRTFLDHLDFPADREGACDDECTVSGTLVDGQVKVGCNTLNGPAIAKLLEPPL